MLIESEHHKKESMLDPMLQIGNRRYAETMFHVLQFDLKTIGNIFGVIFMDTDHFKAINDKYGHPAGDKVLLMVSRTIVILLRHFDIFVRWGGDEFIVCLPNINTKEGLQTVGERFKNFVHNSFITLDGKKVSVSVSIGATLTSVEDSMEDIIKRADSLMYSSKMKGGNQCTIG